MEKTKWVLPSEKNHENRFMLRIEQAESDLTDALELLERLHRKFPTKSINNFLIKFKQPK